MNSFNLRRPVTIVLTTLAGAASIYLATLPNPTQPQKDLGHTTNQIFLVGSQSLMKRSPRKK
ncbi:MAG: hypothetical protein KME43_05225 [Myxacorys chilensis ATA2-1-KO14]|jgi:hypothetical protein|nr:hypothetical protein [Myxacorys chilensis ATA2-1-KO14]